MSAPFLDGCGKFTEERMCLRPVDAGVGDALAIRKGLAVYESLASCDEIAFDHETHDAAFPTRDLL
jgi:hypothetical protein